MLSFTITSCTPPPRRLVVSLAASQDADNGGGVHPSFLRRNEAEWREIALFLAGYRMLPRQDAPLCGQAQRRTQRGAA